MAVQKPQINLESRYQWGYDIPLSTPFVIYWEPSGYCNLQCRFCPYTLHSKDTKKNIMTFTTFYKMIKDIKEFSPKLKLFRICGNGEPLMNKNLVTMLGIIRQENIADKIQLITNGTLLNQNLINKLTCDLDMIVISLEGLNTKDYLNISNTKIDYNRFLYNLKSLYINRKQCTIHIKINNLAINNEKKKNMFLKLFGSICDEIFIENVIPQYPQTNYYYETKMRFNDSIKIDRKIICPQIFKSLQIQANGDVVPCCVDWMRKNILGNIMSTSLLNMWTGKTLTELQNVHLNGKRFTINPCKDCLMNEYSDVDNIDCLLRKNII